MKTPQTFGHMLQHAHHVLGTIIVGECKALYFQQLGLHFPRPRLMLLFAVGVWLTRKEQPTWLPSTPHFKPQDFRPTPCMWRTLILPSNAPIGREVGAPIRCKQIFAGGPQSYSARLWPPFLLACGWERLGTTCVVVASLGRTTDRLRYLVSRGPIVDTPNSLYNLVRWIESRIVKSV